MTEPFWIDEELALEFHRLSLAAAGGADGVRDLGLLQSALARPRQLHAYEGADVLALAAAYVEGIVRNHPFVDGNKRTGFVVGITFLELNGFTFTGGQVEAAEAVVRLAAREINGEAFRAYLAANSTPA